MATWKGAISIGGTFLVPVSIDKVAKINKTTFQTFHSSDMGQVGKKNYCKSCGQDLSASDIVKGVSNSKKEIPTIFSQSDFDNLPIQSKRVIEVKEFVNQEELPFSAYDENYYMVPTEIAVKPFSLLAEGLKRTSKVAIGKVTFSNREHLCAVRAMNGSLILTTMRFSDEIKESPNIPTATLPDKEINLMEQIIGKFSQPFKYDSYKDEYENAVREIVRAKHNNEEVAPQAEEKKEEQSLEDSLRKMLNEE